MIFLFLGDELFELLSIFRWIMVEYNLGHFSMQLVVLLDLMKTLMTKVHTVLMLTSSRSNAICSTITVPTSSVSVFLIRSVAIAPLVSLSTALSTLVTSADSPDNALRYQYWDVEYARPYSDAANDFELGFRDDARAQFRWVRREPADLSERPDLRLVPLFPRQLLGPVAAWDAQDEGKYFPAVCDDIDECNIDNLCFR